MERSDTEHIPDIGTPEYFGRVVGILMEIHKLTPGVWAERVGMDSTTMQAIAAGERLPSLEELTNLGSVLEFHPYDRAEMFLSAGVVPLDKDTAFLDATRSSRVTPPELAKAFNSLRSTPTEYIQIIPILVTIGIGEVVGRIKRRFR